MTAPHPFVAIRSRDQWRRVAHTNTDLPARGEGVQLARRQLAIEASAEAVDASPAPAVMDPWCRLYRISPRTGEILMWRNPDSRHTVPVSLLGSTASAAGEFNWADADAGPLQSPRGIAVDADGRLFVSEQGRDRILVWDLRDRRFIQGIHPGAGSAPREMAADGFDIYVLTARGVGITGIARQFQLLPGALAGRRFDRITVCDGRILVLENAGREDARIVPWWRPEDAKSIPFASDVHWLNPHRLVVADSVSDMLTTWSVEPLTERFLLTADGVLRVKHYDHRGLVVTADGGVGYFSAKGYRRAVAVKPRYKTRGRVVCFALDSGQYQNQWGVVYVDACIPAGCDVRLRFVSDDEISDFRRLSRPAAENDDQLIDPLPAADLSPAMPRDNAIVPFEDAADPGYRLFRRGPGDELVHDEYHDNERLVTYETPTHAGPGRFLWVIVELSGSGRATPLVSSLRVQTNGHTLLDHLPRLFRRDPGVASFLKRFLAMPESMLTGFDMAAFTRHVMLDPYGAREEWLPWLAGFVGLVFDQRFTPDTRRHLIAEAVSLFRVRGTVPGLTRFLEIVVQAPIIVVEKYKLRGHAARLEAEGPAPETSAVLGADYRLGDGRAGAASSNTAVDNDNYAHRFSVIIAASLSTDDMQMVQLVIATHRPAHTLFDVCTVDAGMRIGRGLYLQINSLLGQSGGFAPMHLDAGVLGRDGVLGIAKTASTASGGRLDQTARLG